MDLLNFLSVGFQSTVSCTT